MNSNEQNVNFRVIEKKFTDLNCSKKEIELNICIMKILEIYLNSKNNSSFLFRVKHQWKKGSQILILKTVWNTCDEYKKNKKDKNSFNKVISHKEIIFFGLLSESYKKERKKEKGKDTFIFV